ncbi:hypothetical protein HQN60_11935 [Deefgea piscis]|uniref:Uncharacterized protein n=1 Tax=Deefgea piscis TaxID=2739061 RepID=A0A6M8SQ04_9NEIS|nr:hypothetical protein [Deefgea piscis]QKJ67353.1 hypothetical protein HQN60_11935 [Deefgea piscis]
MDIVPQELLCAVAKVAKEASLSPEQTMALAFRVLDHPILAPNGVFYSPARCAGFGRAIYAALFAHSMALVVDLKSPTGFRWSTALPSYGFSPPFEQFLLDGILLAKAQRTTVKNTLHG